MSATVPRLMVIEAGGQRFVEIGKPRFTIGRLPDRDLTLAGIAVSKEHAEIVAEDGAYVLHDTHSRFGTYINGERTSKCTLRHGDHIDCGLSHDTTIIFLDGEPRPQAADSSVASSGTSLRDIGALLQRLRGLGSGRVVDDVLALVIDTAINMTNADRGFVMLGGAQGRLEFKLARARGGRTLAGRTFATSRKIPEKVFATARPEVVRDLTLEDPNRQRETTINLGIRHIVCMPLKVVRYVERRADDSTQKPCIGVLYLDSETGGELHSAATLSSVEALCEEATLAIENARLYRESLDKGKIEQELRLAADIQRRLLPLGTRAGAFFEAAGASVPCRAIGGDFFDYADRSGGEFAFIVGDVAGKGAPAALLATATLGMFRAERRHHERAASLVANLNDALMRSLVDARYVTAFYGIVHANGQFLFCNAGHNAPLLLTRSGIRRLTTGGLVLGLFDRPRFDEESIVLTRGDSIVAFSDGVTEALNVAGEEFTDSRLTEVAERHRSQEPQVLVAAVLNAVRAFCGDALPNDDVTIVAVRYTGS